MATLHMGSAERSKPDPFFRNSIIAIALLGLASMALFYGVAEATTSGLTN
ncbi:MAG: hypothetical protein AAB955_00505 [Patescibacteria group bacterium]